MLSVNFRSVEIYVCCTVVGIDICFVDLSVSSAVLEVINSVFLVEAKVKFLINAVLVTELEEVTKEIENSVDAYWISYVFIYNK